MYYNRAYQILLAGAMAASASDAFAPPKSASGSRSYHPSGAAPASTRVAYISNTLSDVPPTHGLSFHEPVCATEALDAAIDTFADPNDKRYSASDWFHNMQSLPNSAILREIKGPVGWITAWSTLVSIVHKLCSIGGLGRVADTMCLGSTPHSLISSVIGLLLVFRTNSAYQRFKVSYVLGKKEKTADDCVYELIYHFVALSFLNSGGTPNMGATPQHMPRHHANDLRL